MKSELDWASSTPFGGYNINTQTGWSPSPAPWAPAHPIVGGVGGNRLKNIDCRVKYAGSCAHTIPGGYVTSCDLSFSLKKSEGIRGRFAFILNTPGTDFSIFQSFIQNRSVWAKIALSMHDHHFRLIWTSGVFIIKRKFARISEDFDVSAYAYIPPVRIGTFRARPYEKNPREGRAKPTEGEFFIIFENSPP